LRTKKRSLPSTGRLTAGRTRTTTCANRHTHCQENAREFQEILSVTTAVRKEGRVA
jgi:hypothetical protein